MNLGATLFEILPSRMGKCYQERLIHLTIRVPSWMLRPISHCHTEAAQDINTHVVRKTSGRRNGYAIDSLF